MNPIECGTGICEAFLSGKMSDLDVSEFEQHLGSCPVCQSELDRAIKDDGLLNSMRELMSLTTEQFQSRKAAHDEPLSSLIEGPNRLREATAGIVLTLLSPSDDPAVAGRLGQYDIHGIIGRGSAGIVLKGFDHSLHRNVAIKILDPSLANLEEARLRFSREAKAMAAVSSEHVVSIFEVSEHAGLPYLVMEYMPGGSLEKRLHEGGPLDVIAIVRIGWQIAQAMAAAHSQGLVHRDIKPGNILLDRGTERVRVADFGLVRTLDDASCTRSGFITGTPQYMSPEQVRGEPCDAQSDLFSLGSVMYALCTRQPPFRADSIYGVMQRVVHDSPWPIREINPTIPGWLDEFIQRLMAKDRESRFASATVIADILQNELAALNDPKRTAEPRRGWRFPRQANRPDKWQLRLTASVFCVVALVGVVVFPLVRDRLFPKPAQAVSSSSNVTANGPESSLYVPLWSEDGTRELQERVRQVQENWHPMSNDRVSPEGFQIDSKSIRIRLQRLRDELVPE